MQPGRHDCSLNEHGKKTESEDWVWSQEADILVVITIGDHVGCALDCKGYDHKSKDGEQVLIQDKSPVWIPPDQIL